MAGQEPRDGSGRDHTLLFLAFPFWNHNKVFPSILPCHSPARVFPLAPPALRRQR